MPRTPNHPALYAAYSASYDTIMARGDHSPAQQARLALVLYAAVCVEGELYGSADYHEYKRQALRGAAYLTKHNFGITPDASELAELGEYFN